MTPDEQHQEYYKENPNGNHYSPAPETLRFMEKQEKINEAIMNNLSDIKVHLGKQDVVITEGFKITHQKQDYTNGTVKDHEKRLTVVEKKIIYWSAGLATLVGVMEFLGNYPRIIQLFVK
jgi:molybdopterin-guanine dinucleotide biosynthesis protein